MHNVNDFPAWEAEKALAKIVYDFCLGSQAMGNHNNNNNKHLDRVYAFCLHHSVPENGNLSETVHIITTKTSVFSHYYQICRV